MTGTQIQDQMDFENRLKIGDIVTVRWTNNYNHYSQIAQVVKINGKSIRAALLFGDIIVNGRVIYMEGTEIIVPRIAAFDRWTANNCVSPRS